jgi:CRISPR-associated protein Cas2
MQTYLACFDIQDDRNRRQVATLLGKHGLRVQKSVFEISVRSPEQLQKLHMRAQRWLGEGDDLRFYHLCCECRQKSHAMDARPVADFPLAVML